MTRAPHNPRRATSGELVGGVVRVVEVHHRDALEPAGVVAAEIRDPVVVRAHRERDHVGDRHREQDEALARVDHRAPDPVGLVLREVGGGVVGGGADVAERRRRAQLVGILDEAVTGLDPDERHRLPAVDVPPVAVGLRHHTRRPIAEHGHEALPDIGRLDDVGVRRDHPRGGEHVGNRPCLRCRRHSCEGTPRAAGSARTRIPVLQSSRGPVAS